MAISEAARKNHDELFPAHGSTLKITDPELVEYFDNFAFDEVLRYGSLNTRTRLMVQLASLIACQALSEYRVMLGAALTVGVTPIEAKEIVYQAVPYAGMARVFDFIQSVEHPTFGARQLLFDHNSTELPGEGALPDVVRRLQHRAAARRAAHQQATWQWTITHLADITPDTAHVGRRPGGGTQADRV
jgi:alkylhydroperoxidase/carboxymuconolactone decarboxylase family protein YurZ